MINGGKSTRKLSQVWQPRRLKVNTSPPRQRHHQARPPQLQPLPALRAGAAGRKLRFKIKTGGPPGAGTCLLKATRLPTCDNFWWILPPLIMTSRDILGRLESVTGF